MFGSAVKSAAFKANGTMLGFALRLELRPGEFCIAMGAGKSPTLASPSSDNSTSSPVSRSGSYPVDIGVGCRSNDAPLDSIRLEASLSPVTKLIGAYLFCVSSSPSFTLHLRPALLSVRFTWFIRRLLSQGSYQAAFRRSISNSTFAKMGIIDGESRPGKSIECLRAAGSRANE